MSMNTTQRRDVANVLKAEMAALQPPVSISDLCLRTGLSRGTVGGLIRGETGRLDPEVINRICSALDMRVELVLKAAGFAVDLNPEVVGLEVELSRALEGKTKRQQKLIASMIRAIER